jgi:hypothetical protein
LLRPKQIHQRPCDGKQGEVPASLKPALQVAALRKFTQFRARDRTAIPINPQRLPDFRKRSVAHAVFSLLCWLGNLSSSPSGRVGLMAASGCLGFSSSGGPCAFVIEVAHLEYCGAFQIATYSRA